MPITHLQDPLDHGAAIDVIADVTFLPTSEGGRTGPVRGRYRPNHNFGAADNHVTSVGQIQFAPGDDVRPGDTRRVQIRFLNGPGLDELLAVGCEWRIQEGDQLVARGKVVERLPGVGSSPA